MVSKYMYFLEKQFYQIAIPHMDMVTHGQTSPHMVGDGQTSSHRYFAQKLPYTIEHSFTWSYIRPHTVKQNLFLPHTDDSTQLHTVAHGRTDNRTWSQKSTAARMAYPHQYM